MRYSPEIAAILSAEENSRTISWLQVAPDLCGVRQAHLTPRAQNELMLAGNAFFTTRRALLADVFDFLWRLHPGYRRPLRPHYLRRRSVNTLQRRLTLWLAFGDHKTAQIFHTLERHVRRIDLHQAESQIRAHLEFIFQDRPATDESSESATDSLFHKPRAHWLDNYVDFFASRYGWPVDHILDQPMARLLQLYRATAIAHGDLVIDNSARKINEFIFSRHDLAKAASQRN